MSTSCSPRPDLHGPIAIVRSTRRSAKPGRQHPTAAPGILAIVCDEAGGEREVTAKPHEVRMAIPPVWETREMNYLLVFIGGGLGSSRRHLINGVSLRCPRTRS